MSSARRRRLSRADIVGVRWFLTAAVSIAVFVTLAQHYFWRHWFGLFEIFGLLAISILLGLLFSVIFLAAAPRSVGIELQDSTNVGGTQKALPHTNLALREAIEIDAVSFHWQEQLHAAAVSLFGVPWSAFKAICLSLIVVAPSIVYALKLSSTSAFPLSPMMIAIVFALGFFAVATFIGVLVALRALVARVTTANSSTRIAFRITRDALQTTLRNQGEVSIPWCDFDRVIQTSRIIGLVSSGRLVLVVPRRVLDLGIINGIQQVVEDRGN